MTIGVKRYHWNLEQYQFESTNYKVINRNDYSEILRGF
jgi:hypothetical protein